MAGFVRLPDPLSQRRIVFVRTDRLGETLLNLPAIHALRQAYPNTHLTLMLHSSIEELLVGHPDVDAVVTEPVLQGPWWYQAWRLSRLWRSWHPDIILISNPKQAYHVGAWLAGIPVRVGYHRKCGWLLTHRVPDEKASGERHEVDCNLDLVRALGVAVSDIPPLRLPVRAEAVVTLNLRLAAHKPPHDHRVVVVHPWTSNPRKQWPVERFWQLIRRLQTIPSVTLVVIGGPEERAQLPTRFPECLPGVADLVGKLSLQELAALFQRSHILVSNDSGPVHLAAAVGVQVVALFGTADAGSHPRRWGPWGSGHTVIHKPLEQIAVEEVAAAVERHLA